MKLGYLLVAYCQLAHTCLYMHSCSYSCEWALEATLCPVNPTMWSLSLYLCLSHCESGCWKRIHYYLFIIIITFFFVFFRAAFIVCAVNIWRLSPAEGRQQQQQGHHHHHHRHHVIIIMMLFMHSMRHFIVSCYFCLHFANVIALFVLAQPLARGRDQRGVWAREWRRVAT